MKLALLVILPLVIAPGCCWTKRVFGFTDYRVEIRTENESAAVPVLLVWPSPELLGDFGSLGYDEVVDRLTYLKPGRDFVAADFGSVPPGKKPPLRYETLEGETMHRHCSGDKAFVYTVVGEGRYPVPGEFTGELRIVVEDDAVEARWVESLAWD